MTLMRRAVFRDRRASEWTLDGSGLLVQGIVVPLLQTTVLYLSLARLAPAWKASIHLSGWAAFLVNFVVIDYAYYWNHRVLHGQVLWRWHAVHHTAREMDVIVTSRNTLGSHFLILYFWINALWMFLLVDPTSYLLAVALTAGLDLWRHSPTYPGKGTLANRLLGTVLITPHEHAWHHSANRTGCNFGANLNWWDKMHGTYYSPPERPARLGIDPGWTFLQRLLWPAGLGSP